MFRWLTAIPFSVGVFAQSASAQEDLGFGEQQIRAEFQQFQKSPRTADALSGFMQRHFLNSISEIYLSANLTGEKLPEGPYSNDPSIATHQIRDRLSSHPFQIQNAI